MNTIKMQRILFLYTELAGYFLSCIQELSQRDVEVHIVRWPVNAEAPFNFSFPDNVTIYERSDFTDELLLAKIEGIQPDKIYCSGWVDKGYVAVCKRFFSKIPTILSMDNQWHGNLRQQVARLAAPLTLKRTYSHAWVPGEPQKQYAIKLGFKEDTIQTGFYSADVANFTRIGVKRVEATAKLPKRFVFIGRYIPQKGIDKLFHAFLELLDEGYLDWELWCMGAGELFEQRPIHEKIKHLGFVQPQEMRQYLTETGVFILPSDFEPWGVVVHEMAAAGFPMIVSSAVGSVTRFLEDEVNGFIFPKGNKDALKQAMKQMMELSDEVLLAMAQASKEKGQSWTPGMWAEIAIGAWE